MNERCQNIVWCKKRMPMSMLRVRRNRMTIINGCTWDAFLGSAQLAPCTGSRPFLYDLWHVRQQPVRLETWQELTLRTRVTQCRSPRSLPLSTRNPADRPCADKTAAVLHAKFSPIACLLLLLETTCYAFCNNPCTADYDTCTNRSRVDKESPLATQTSESRSNWAANHVI